jgi:hypothetical protein
LLNLIAQRSRRFGLEEKSDRVGSGMQPGTWNSWVLASLVRGGTLRPMVPCAHSVLAALLIGTALVFLETITTLVAVAVSDGRFIQ